MTLAHAPDVPRTVREALADEAYCRLRHLLEVEPEVFVAVREGLAIGLDNLDDRVMRVGCDDALARSRVSSGAVADGWLLRATYRYWLLLPEAFDCGEDLPLGVNDQRYESVAKVMSREGLISDGGAAPSQLDAW